jgi:hypothetical protein
MARLNFSRPETVTTDSVPRTPIEKLEPQTRARFEAIKSFVEAGGHLEITSGTRRRVLERLARAGSLSDDSISKVWHQSDRIARDRGLANAPWDTDEEITPKRAEGLNRDRAIRAIGEAFPSLDPYQIAPAETETITRIWADPTPLSREARTPYGQGRTVDPGPTPRRPFDRAPWYLIGQISRPASLDSLKVIWGTLARAAGIFGKRRAEGETKSPQTVADYRAEIARLKAGDTPQIRVAQTPAQRKAKSRSKSRAEAEAEAEARARLQDPKVQAGIDALFSF